MRIDRAAHIPWAMFVLVASALASFFYAARFHPQRLPAGARVFGEWPPEHATIGGTRVGLLFGALAFAIFIFAALLGARKKLPWLPFGNVRRWMRAHIWLTFLSVPLILLHSGFHLGGPMTTVLMALYAVVMVSGIYGLILQHKLPTLMKEKLPAEIVYEQIPTIRAQLVAAAEKLLRTLQREGESAAALARLSGASAHAVVKTPTAAEKTSDLAMVPGAHLPATDVLETRPDEVTFDEASERVLAAFIERRLLPYLRAQRRGTERLAARREAEDVFRHLKMGVAPLYRARVEEMRRWCDERRLLDLQVRMQHWLHGWLFVHVPLSFLLLFLTAWHAFVTLFHY